MTEKVQAKNPIFVVDTMKSCKAGLVKGATAPGNGTVLPIGYPLVAKGDGTYEVFTKAALATQLVGSGSTLPKNIAILCEEVTVGASMPVSKVCYAGGVYLEGMREATDISTTDVADHIFINALGHIVFEKLNTVQIYDLEG